MLVKGGATVLFSEVTEVRDGVHLLAARCRDAAARDKLAAEMKWYDDYLDAGGVDRDANPTPGNKKGGLANIVEKAMGSIAKSGTAPIEEVLSPAEKPHKHLRRHSRQRHRLRPLPAGQRHRASGLYDRPGHPLRAGRRPGHQGLLPQRDEGALV